jgi:hypothetical protein
MFCSRCGTRVPEGATFCHSCGARVVLPELESSRPPERQHTGDMPSAIPAPPPPSFAADRRAATGEQHWETSPTVGSQAADRFAEPTRPPVSAPTAAVGLQISQDGIQLAIGAVVLIGGILAIIGSFTAWVDLGFASANGFAGGYLTDPHHGDGKDGLLILIGGIVGCVSAPHYLFARNVWASLLIMLLGVGIAALAGYNLGRIVYDAKHQLNMTTSAAFDLIGSGLYLSIAGGAVTAIGAFIGSRRAAVR